MPSTKAIACNKKINSKINQENDIPTNICNSTTRLTIIFAQLYYRHNKLYMIEDNNYICVILIMFIIYLINPEGKVRKDSVLHLTSNFTCKASKILCLLMCTSKDSRCVSKESGECVWSSFKYFVASSRGSSTYIIIVTNSTQKYQT